MDTRVRILNYVLERDGRTMHIGNDEVLSSCQAIRHTNKIDMDGLCVQIILATARATHRAIANLLSIILSDTATMTSLRVRACLFGKRGPDTAAKDTRAIIPLGAVMQICDSILANRFHCKLNALCPDIDGCFFNAQPQTQTLEIAHAAHLVLEKGMDAESAGSVAQAAVQTFYDSLP